MRLEAAAIVGLLAGNASAGDWPYYRHDLLGTSNAGEPLSTAEAARWNVKWKFETHGPNYSNPVVVGNVVYMSSGDGQTYAIDATTGGELWQQSTTILGPFQCLPGVTEKGPVGAPAVVGDDVYQPGGDGYVYDYAAADGAIRWKTKIADVNAGGDFLWSSAFPVHDKIYVGVSSLHDCVLVPGRMVALDGKTGQVVGTWWADITHHGGGGVWTQPAYDARTNRLFMTTGTLAADRTSQQQPWAQAIVAIDADTMETVDYQTTVPTSFTVDNDFGASPVLYDTAGGQHLVAAVNKNGIAYAWDRDHLSAGVKWQRTIGVEGAPDPDVGGCSISSPAYANGRLFVGTGITPTGRAGSVVALDPETGEVIWADYFDEFFLPAITVTGDVVFASSTHEAKKANGTPYPGGGVLYVLAQSDGRVVSKLPSAVGQFGEPTYANGMLLFPDLGQKFFALVPVDGGTLGGTGVSDGGTGGTDGGTGVDGGTFSMGGGELPGTTAPKPCGCASSGGGFFALAAVALLARRRRGS